MGGEKGLSSKLTVTPLIASVPSSPSVLKAVDVESIPFHELGETIIILGDDSMPNAQPLSVAPTDVLSQEELDVLLERFTMFINMESPVSHMNELFLMLERIPVDVIVDPS